MEKFNFHTHSTFSDGAETPENVIIEALDKDFKIIGFSDHSPVPFASEWNMKFENLLSYADEINSLKLKYEGKIQIFLGIEADFIENITYFEIYKKLNFDYIIGGVHYLPLKLNNNIFNIDKSPENFELGLKEIFNNDIKILAEKYYDAVIKMVKSQKPDIIAHLDIIEKFNRNYIYFNSNEKWYKELVFETLKIISQHNCIIELNSRSKYKGLLNYYSPCDWIVQEASKLKIPLTISGDVHHPKEFSFFWEDSIEYIKESGLKSHQKKEIKHNYLIYSVLQRMINQF